MTRVKVAIVGAGYMAGEHAKAFSAMTDVDLVGIQSRSRGRAEQLAQTYPALRVFDTISEMCVVAMPDVVVVAVPELSTESVCQEVFNYPVLALIEKPVGYDPAQARAIAALARARGRQAFVALNRRHYASTRAVLEDVQSVDESRLVNVLDQENPAVALAGGQPALVVENWMYANSIHIIDYFSVFCRGQIDSVDHIMRWNPAAPGFVLAKLNFSSGDVGIYQAAWNAPGPWSVAVSTYAKRWEMRPLEQATVQAGRARRSEPIQPHVWDQEFKPGIRQQAEEVIRAARGQAHSLPSLDAGLVTMDLVERIYGH